MDWGKRNVQLLAFECKKPKNTRRDQRYIVNVEYDSEGIKNRKKIPARRRNYEGLEGKEEHEDDSVRAGKGNAVDT